MPQTPPPPTCPYLRQLQSREHVHSPSRGQSLGWPPPTQFYLLMRPGLLGRCQSGPHPLMALLPGVEGLRGGDGSCGPEWGKGSKWPGLTAGWGWLRGQQSQRVRDQIPGDVLTNPLPGSELCWSQGSAPSQEVPSRSGGALRRETSPTPLGPPCLTHHGPSLLTSRSMEP